MEGTEAFVEHDPFQAAAVEEGEATGLDGGDDAGQVPAGARGVAKLKGEPEKGENEETEADEIGDGSGPQFPAPGKRRGSRRLHAVSLMSRN